MDPNSIVAAQLNASNQLRFDQSACDRAVLRQEHRKAKLSSLWSAGSAAFSRIRMLAVSRITMAAAARSS